MLAINWFEVILPSLEFDAQVEAIPEGSKRQPKELGHRTLQKEGLLVHIAIEQLPSLPIRRLKASKYPSLMSYAIEDGFARKMVSSGLDVQLIHVGGVGIRPKRSLGDFQDIFVSMEGLAFRCFSGFGDDEQIRWGLVLRYVTRHRFRLNLEDRNLRKLAVGRRIVPFETSHSDRIAEASLPRSGFLTEAMDEHVGTLQTEDGIGHTISLREWTLPCNPENLSAFVRITRGAEKVGKIAVQLQKEAFALNSNGRINNNYARDQLSMVKTLLDEYQLAIFDLTLLERPLVRLNTDPLLVGT